MKYAIISTGGKQYSVEEGKSLQVELLDSSTGSVVFDHVLLTVDGEKVEIGTPELSGVKVYGTITKEIKADKIQVFKYKSKSRYRKLRGHRQSLALVKIESIGKEPVKVAPAKVEKKTEAKKEVVKKTPVKKVTTKKTVEKKTPAKKTAK